jgi:hypothetical protein
MMRASIALEAGDTRGAAAALAEIVNVPSDKTPEQIVLAIQAGLDAQPQDGVIERVMNGLLESEKAHALVKPEYASLQKAFVLYTGYSPYLPKDYLYKSLQRAGAARLIKTAGFWTAAKLALSRVFRSRAAFRAQLESLIERM